VTSSTTFTKKRDEDFMDEIESNTPVPSGNESLLNLTTPSDKIKSNYGFVLCKFSLIFSSQLR
jgi:hypothetical protein